MPISERYAFLVDHLFLPEVLGIDNAEFDPWQASLLCDSARFSCDVKSRQIGWSFIIALEILAESYLQPGTESQVISYRLDDAREKIRWINRAEAALYRGDGKRFPQYKRIIDTQTEIEWANGSRVVSVSRTPPRGKPGSVYYDELAWTQDAGEVYKAGTFSLLRRPDARLRMGSSPAGKTGIFWEVATEELRAYPGYTRRLIPWWLVPQFCIDIRAAKEQAALMPTRERVERFGQPSLRELYENTPEEDFQQECECDFSDESFSWISWDLIRQAQSDDLVCFQARSEGGKNQPAISAIEQFAKVLPSFSGCSWFAGLDVGRRHDLTELTVLSRDGQGKLSYRLGISLHNTPFADQEALAGRVMDMLPTCQLAIDRNGIGMQLAENLTAKHGWRAQGMDFTAPSKEATTSPVIIYIWQNGTLYLDAVQLEEGAAPTEYEPT